MPTLTISDRRAIATAAMLRPDFRDLLRDDPRRAIADATDRAAPDLMITVIEERPDAWEFVVPAGAIEAELPEPLDPRSVVENDVYALLRDDPTVRARVIGDPKAFLAEKFNLDIGDAGVNVHQEQAGRLLIILPCGDAREELNDDVLDLVAGGGSNTAQGGKPTDDNLRAGGA